MTETEIIINPITIIWDSKSKQSVFFDSNNLKFLNEQEKIRVEGIGTPVISRKQNKLLSSPFFLTKYETLFLYEKKFIVFESEENEKVAKDYFEKLKLKEKYIIYKDLKSKNYFVTSGFKFGAYFLAYKGIKYFMLDDPIIMHSEFIIFVKKFSEEFNLEDIIQYERISNVTLKSFILASVDKEGICQYLNFSWENFKINK